MTTHRAPADPVGADLLRLLKTLKLGALADTLPERPRWPASTTSATCEFLNLCSPTRSPAAKPAQPHCEPPPPAWTRPCVWTPGPHRMTCASTDTVVN